jgi:hypothetical protein
MTEELQRIDLDARHPEVALGRLGYVAGLIDRRKVTCWRAEHTGEAPFEVHVYGDPQPLLDDGECRAGLQLIVTYAEACNIELVFHRDLRDVLGVFGTVSSTFAATLAAGIEKGHVKQGAVPGDTPADRWSVIPAGDAEGELYSRSLSAEVWASLMLGDADTLVRIFEALNAASKHAATDDTQARARLLSDALRRAADCILPGAGGMLGDVTFCPLCLGSPMVRLDEVPSHLLALHAAGAIEGALGPGAVK